MVDVMECLLFVRHCARQGECRMNEIQVLNCMELIIRVIRTRFMNVFFLWPGQSRVSAANFRKNGLLVVSACIQVAGEWICQLPSSLSHSPFYGLVPSFTVALILLCSDCLSVWFFTGLWAPRKRKSPFSLELHSTLSIFNGGCIYG